MRLGPRDIRRDCLRTSILLLVPFSVTGSVTPQKQGSPGPNTILFSENFDRADSASGLPSGWSVLPVAHRPWVRTARDSTVYGAAPPSLRVDRRLKIFKRNID